MKKTLLICLFISLYWMMSPRMVFAQTTVEKLQGLFIANFLKYIVLEESEKECLISYFGDEVGYNSLNSILSGRTIGGRAIIFKFAKAVSELEHNTDVVFISNSQTKVYKEVRQKLNGKSKVMYITEVQGGAKAGAHINFIIVDGKCRFEINQKEMEKSGFKVARELLNMAILIE